MGKNPSKSTKGNSGKGSAQVKGKPNTSSNEVKEALPPLKYPPGTEVPEIIPGADTPVGAYYRNPDQDWPAPPPITDPKTKEEVKVGTARKGKPSIFNRYSVFFFDNTTSGSNKPEEYIDKIARIDQELQDLRWNPTAKNIIAWSKSGKNNAVEYSSEDFLWCKYYGVVPNNYMVTLRRFPQPCNDDLFDPLKNKFPDVGRMLTWVDGEALKWENVGLKWAHNVNWKDLEADIQVMQAQGGWGNETGALGGLGMIGKSLQVLASISDTNASNAARSHNPNTESVNPYADKNKIFGPIDVVRKQKIRDKGLEFEQKFELRFEYELRAIDGINSKVAFLDLLSNILLVTSNKGSFWGGDRRFYGGNPRKVSPFGDPNKLASGDYAGYMDSLMKGLTDRVDELSKGKGFSIPEGVGNILKSLGGNLMSQITGGALDKMGRPGAQAMDSLLTGADTGEWHVTVGNPANPIIQVGNLALTKTNISLEGALGPDDFPTKIVVTCSLEPARPRDRLDMMAMFSRNNRMYVTSKPTTIKFNTKVKSGEKKGIGASQDKQTVFNESTIKEEEGKEIIATRFPNHTSGGAATSYIVDAASNLIE